MIHKTAKNEEVQGYGLPKVSLQNHKKNLKFKHFKGVVVNVQQDQWKCEYVKNGLNF